MTEVRKRTATRRRDTPPPRTGPAEKEVLIGFLDYLRTSVAGKLDGAPEPAVRRSAVASGTTLIGLVRHLTHVERALFLGATVANWPATFRAAPNETIEDVLTAYRAAVADANAVIDAADDLAEPVPRPPGATAAPSMRWALTHMIEETGRHAGHADILRELIDNTTGR